MAPVLPPAVPGTRRTFGVGGRRVSCYADGPTGRPLLLIHSINAVASAYEVKPIYEHYRLQRPVRALELPGFGFSDRADVEYRPRRMIDAIKAALGDLGQPADVLALSLSSEFAACAALELPQAVRTLALVSPTGFSNHTPRSSPRLLAFLRLPPWNRALFRLLTTRPSIRYFLRKTWGGPDIDEGLADYGFTTGRQEGARHAPYYFVSGCLFDPDIMSAYRKLQLPVWLAHGTRGDFVDYSKETQVAGKPNWSLQVFQTGALPHFERPDEFFAAYDGFLAGSAAR